MQFEYLRTAENQVDTWLTEVESAGNVTYALPAAGAASGHAGSASAAVAAAAREQARAADQKRRLLLPSAAEQEVRVLMLLVVHAALVHTAFVFTRRLPTVPRAATKQLPRGQLAPWLKLCSEIDNVQSNELWKKAQIMTVPVTQRLYRTCAAGSAAEPCRDMFRCSAQEEPHCAFRHALWGRKNRCSCKYGGNKEEEQKEEAAWLERRLDAAA